jgi:hypothetical protein
MRILLSTAGAEHTRYRRLRVFLRVFLHASILLVIDKVSLVFASVISVCHCPPWQSLSCLFHSVTIAVIAHQLSFLSSILRVTPCLVVSYVLPHRVFHGRSRIVNGPHVLGSKPPYGLSRPYKRTIHRTPSIPFSGPSFHVGRS